MRTPIAVLTGDLVLSQQTTKAVRKSIPHFLGKAVENLQAADLSVSTMDVFRGDGWQLVVGTPSESLRVALYLRAYCRSSALETDTRVAIGLGTSEGVIAEPVSTSIGPPFAASGLTLDAMPRNRRMQIAFEETRVTPVDLGLLDASFHLLDRIVDQWTAAQARVTAASLLGSSQEEIGSTWTPRPISQQAVAQHLRRAAWHAVDHFVSAYSDLVKRSGEW